MYVAGPALQESQTFYSTFATHRPSAPVRTAPGRARLRYWGLLCSSPARGSPEPWTSSEKIPWEQVRERAEEGQAPTEKRVRLSALGLGRHFRKTSVKPGFPSAYIPLSQTSPNQLASSPCAQRPLSLTADLQPQFPGASMGHAAPGVVHHAGKQDAFSEARTAWDPAEGKGVLGEGGGRSFLNELRV